MQHFYLATVREASKQGTRSPEKVSAEIISSRISLLPPKVWYRERYGTRTASVAPGLSHLQPGLNGITDVPFFISKSFPLFCTDY